MAKRKAKAGSTKRAKAKRKAAGRKKTIRKVTKKAAKRPAKRPKVKRAAKKAVRKGTKRARVAGRKPAAKPKLLRRTKPAMPPVSRPAPPRVVEVEPFIPPPPPPPIPGGPGGAPEAPPGSGMFGESESAEPPIDADAPGAGSLSQACAALEVGDPAPDFALPDETGRTHRLSDYRGQKVVLYFYPKDDTPGCTTEACGFRDRLGSFTDRSAVVLGVSPDSAESHRRFVEKYGLTFPLLADAGHAVAERYGVWVAKARAGRTSMGIARTTFLIDADGRIAHIFRNVRPDGHEQEVLHRLASI